jgi:hypothetical protein
MTQKGNFKGLVEACRAFFEDPFSSVKHVKQQTNDLPPKKRQGF